MPHPYTTKAFGFFDLYGYNYDAFYGTTPAFAALLDTTN